MNYLSNFFNTTIQLNIYIIVIVAACYIAIHQYRHKACFELFRCHFKLYPCFNT